MEASFHCWDTKSNALYAHTVATNTEVPGIPYVIIKFEIDIDA